MAQFKTQKFTFFAPRNVILLKKLYKYFADIRKSITFATHFGKRMHNKGDSLAQQVEHNTFNVGVLGSSPRRIT